MNTKPLPTLLLMSFLSFLFGPKTATAQVKPVVPLEEATATCHGLTLKTGSGWETELYSDDNKLFSRSLFTIVGLETVNDSTWIMIDIQSVDAKNKPHQGCRIQVVCLPEGTQVDLIGLPVSGYFMYTYMDALLLPRASSQAYILPASLKTGQSLPDVVLDLQRAFPPSKARRSALNRSHRSWETYVIDAAGTIAGELAKNQIGLRITLSKQQVHEARTVDTPAGSFPAHRLTATMDIRNHGGLAVGNSTLDMAVYRSAALLPNVRSEVYLNGKLSSYEVLKRIF
ncbi:hypothetical protein [Arsenicibacter rosenii]|uniref:Uncharacterized protein n=1 Tax=Arsenicibacter rosenii TaxID=1750698 RepID=A0A1S2VF72_9BACT|nr:hypothetical protein [Arsenicibacter rosenii]OIN57407.1 hypothetical protein BLX24_19425 [Arsenicibacter rosenii]